MAMIHEITPDGWEYLKAYLGLPKEVEYVPVLDASKRDDHILDTERELKVRDESSVTCEGCSCRKTDVYEPVSGEMHEKILAAFKKMDWQGWHALSGERDKAVESYKALREGRCRNDKGLPCDDDELISKIYELSWVFKGSLSLARSVEKYISQYKDRPAVAVYVYETSARLYADNGEGPKKLKEMLLEFGNYCLNCNLEGMRFHLFSAYLNVEDVDSAIRELRDIPSGEFPSSLPVPEKPEKKELQEAWFQKLLDNFPNEPSVFSVVAFYRLEQKDYERAIPLLEKVTQLTSNIKFNDGYDDGYDLDYSRLAWIYADRKQWGKLVDLMDRALASRMYKEAMTGDKSPFLLPYHMKGMALSALGRSKEAVANYEAYREAGHASVSWLDFQEDVKRMFRLQK